MKVKKGIFENDFELAETIYSYSLENSVCLIGDFNFVSEVLKDLFFIDDGYLTIMSIELNMAELDGYDGPFLLTISEDGELWCQKAIYDERKGIVGFEDDIVFVQSKYIDGAVKACLNDEAEFYRIIFSDDDIDQDENLDFQILLDQDEKPCGFEYNGGCDGYCCQIRFCSCEEMSMDDIIKAYNEFCDWFAKHIVN